MTHVLLLRAPSKDHPDRYEDWLGRHGYFPHSIPPLDTELIGLDHLERIVSASPTAQGYDGVIITSARAVEAWRNAVISRQPSSSTSDLLADWSTVPFYAVGEVTASALADIRAACASQLAPLDIRGGSESGTSERLAQYIIKDRGHADPQTGVGKLLYLTGDKTRDVLPRILSDAGIVVKQVQVYCTKGSARFASALEDVLRAAGASAGSGIWWIVYFAPSAAKLVTPTLRGIFDLPMVESSAPPNVGRARIAAIGQTTSAFLRDELGLSVAVVPSRPTVEELVTRLVEFDRMATESAMDGN